METFGECLQSQVITVVCVAVGDDVGQAPVHRIFLLVTTTVCLMLVGNLQQQLHQQRLEGQALAGSLRTCEYMMHAEKQLLHFALFTDAELYFFMRSLKRTEQ